MATVANQDESDEAFARRLQAQEMGIPDAQTPLMINQQPQQANANQNPTVINARFNEMATTRATVLAILFVNVPQIIAATIVLSIHWNESGVCDVTHALKWKWWALISTIRMFAYSAIVMAMYCFKGWLDDHPRRNQQAVSIRNLVDGMGLVWFVIGNMWLFGDDDNFCRHPERSANYALCVAMLVINYVQICLPCIVAILLIPIFCFCMPCLIRLLAHLQNNRAAVGATDASIQALPLTVLSQEDLDRLGDDKTCPICLNELCLEEEARYLVCKHTFHKQCVDEWLRVNASCPTCRQSIHGNGNSTATAAAAPAGAITGAAGGPASLTAAGGGAGAGASAVGGGGGGGSIIDMEAPSSSSSSSLDRDRERARERDHRLLGLGGIGGLPMVSTGSSAVGSGSSGGLTRRNSGESSAAMAAGTMGGAQGSSSLGGGLSSGSSSGSLGSNGLRSSNNSTSPLFGSLGSLGSLSVGQLRRGGSSGSRVIPGSDDSDDAHDL